MTPSQMIRYDCQCVRLRPNSLSVTVGPGHVASVVNVTAMRPILLAASNDTEPTLPSSSLVCISERP